MTKDTKMLQSILTGITDIKTDIKELASETKRNGVKIDNLTESLMYLEEDTPTLKEFNRLGKRVSKLEKRRAVS